MIACGRAIWARLGTERTLSAQGEGTHFFEQREERMKKRTCWWAFCCCWWSPWRRWPAAAKMRPPPRRPPAPRPRQLRAPRRRRLRDGRRQRPQHRDYAAGRQPVNPKVGFSNSITGFSAAPADSTGKGVDLMVEYVNAKAESTAVRSKSSTWTTNRTSPRSSPTSTS